MLNNPIIHIQDEFFNSGSETRAAILKTAFVDVKSEVDNIVYPDINLDIPAHVQKELISKIEKIMFAKVTPRFLFARAMVKGRPVPNKVHSDFNMGRYSAIVYLSPDSPPEMGTGFYKHDSQGYVGNEGTDWSKISHNSMEKWDRYAGCQAKFNRLLIHDSKYWHMAEPQDAWGKGPVDGRLVLTMFFDAEGLGW